MRVVLAVLLCMLSLRSLPQQTQSDTTNPSGTEVGSQLLFQGKYDSARDAFEAVLRSSPTDPQARKGEVDATVALAVGARRQGKLDEALLELLRAQKLVPDDPTLLLDLGLLEDEMQLYRDADKTLTVAIKLRPDDSRIIYALARVKLDLQQLPEAETYMRAYLKVRPEDASAHYGLGRVLQMAQRGQDAEQEFRRSIELQPIQTESYYQLGEIELKSGNFEHSLSYFSTVLARNPRHGGALTGAGEAEYRQKRYQQAADYLKRAVVDAPGYQPAHYYYGLTLARLGQKEDSNRELALAAKMADEQNKKESQRIELNQTTPQ
jgi:tetratricopeptide (TPR) repeat protein